LKLVDTGAQVGDQPLRRGLAERGGRLRVSADGRGTTLLGEEIDRERRIPVAREPEWDRADVIREPAVLVDDEHGALRIGRLRPCTLQLTLRAAELHRLGGGGRAARGRCGLLPGLVAATSVSAARGEERGGAGSGQPEEPEAAQSLPSGEDRIGVVESDLLGEVLAHRHVEERSG
jgi:hypothetical protein